MPRGDRTGPEGMGQRTGRGLGYCNGYQSAGFTRGQGAGLGFGNRAGRGVGRGAGFGINRGFYRNELPVENSMQESSSSIKEEVYALMDRMKNLLDRLEKSDKKE